MKRCTLAVAAVCLFAWACGGQEAPKGDDVEGLWIAAAAESEGKPLPKERLDTFKHRIVLVKGRYLGILDTTIHEEGTYQMDVAKKPATIDFTLPSKDGKPKTQLGIFEMKGDELRMCVAQFGDKERPAKFETKAGANHQLWVYKRDKR